MKIFKRNKKKENKIIHENIRFSGELKDNLEENIDAVKEALGKSSDIIIKDFYIGNKDEIRIGLIYASSLTDKIMIQEYILKSLMYDFKEITRSVDFKHNNIYTILKNTILPNGEIADVDNFEDLFIHLLSGDTVILIDKYPKGYIVSSRDWADRGVQEPSTQTVIRGPKDGFCETLEINISLIRRRIKDTNLWIETKPIGRKTKTDVSIIYMKDLAKESIVQEVRDRLGHIDIDGIFESGNIEELIEDQTWTPFPTIFNTERPDSVAAGLLEGRVAIMVEGTPFVLLVPAIFVQFFQSPEDYYQRYDYGTFTRLLRFSCFFVGLLTPSLYIAFTTFHQEILPSQLLISIAAQREGIPFPAFIEALIMELVFEILREAGLRMPRAIGQAISIVGVLVLGESAVQAGIISPIMIIVLSITALSSFVFPAYNIAISVRLLRFILMILSATLGLYGISIGLLVLVVHLCSLRSFRVPYMTPLAPYNTGGQKDALLRLPLWSFFKRPKLIGNKKEIRQQKPESAKPDNQNFDKS